MEDLEAAVQFQFRSTDPESGLLGQLPPRTLRRVDVAGPRPDALTLVEVPALAISSSDCRLRAQQSRPIWYLVPDGVVQYVSKRNLYTPTTEEARS